MKNTIKKGLALLLTICMSNDITTAYTIAKATVNGASTLSDIDILSNVYVTFDSSVDAGTYTAAWNKTLTDAQTAAGQVTAAKDVPVVFTLQQGGIPAWATLPASMPVVTMTITNKLVIPADDMTLNNITVNYKDTITLQTVGTIVNTATYSGATVAYSFKNNVTGVVTTETPTTAGTYTMEARRKLSRAFNMRQAQPSPSETRQ